MIIKICKKICKAFISRSKQLKSKNNEEYLKSYSQVGEDKLIDFLMSYFTEIDRNNITYVDIGMNHPIIDNNTYFFYKKNGKGLLIEPNKDFCEIASKKRPKDIVINAGIKFDDREISKYYMFNATGLNTFDSGRVESIKAKGSELLKEIEIPLIDINILIKKYLKHSVDYMSIDAEGVDVQILKSINFQQNRPKIICIEANKKEYKFGLRDEIIDYLENKNYVLMGDTTINYIFIDKNIMIFGRYS